MVAEVWYFMTVKQRKILTKKYGSKGYPVRLYEYIGYFSGIAFWLPEEWVVLPRNTKKLWDENPEKAWRVVMIAHILPDIDAIILQYPKLKDIITANFWLDLWQGVQNSVSGLINTVADVDPAMISEMQKTAKEYPIYPNLGFYNTTNDIVLLANQDYVKTDIESMGYTFVEKPEETYVSERDERWLKDLM